MEHIKSSPATEILSLKKVIVDRETQEVIITFTLPVEEIIEISGDELLQKIVTVIEGKEKGENVIELENWLLSLIGKKIRLSGKLLYRHRLDGHTDIHICHEPVGSCHIPTDKNRKSPESRPWQD